jgi:signal transduction histidine kinase
MEPDGISSRLLYCFRKSSNDANFEAGSRNRSVRLLSYFPRAVNGNTDLLRSAMENVIRHAVNYTAEGSEVELALAEEGQGKIALILVRGHGSGVPGSALATIFQLFYRIDGARDRVSGGVGLGLSITGRAVRGHGGTVLARNALDGGLIIEIRLPVGSSVPLATGDTASSDHRTLLGT